MTTDALLIFCAVASGLSLIGITAATFVIFRRLPQTRHLERADVHNGIGHESHDLIHVGENFRSLGSQLNSVISRLSFSESFDPERFAVASQESALTYLNSTLKARAGDGILISVNGIRLLQSGTELTFTATKAGQVMLANGTAVLGRHGSSGEVLPYLTNVSSGRFAGNLRGVPNAMVLTNLAAVSAIVVAAAHMIAGADIAKRLKQMDAKINLLLAYRQIDQTSILERIYTSARELLKGPMNGDKRWEIWRLRRDVRELRYKWRDELRHHLCLIEDRKDFYWIQWMFGYERSFEGNVHRSITEGQLQMGLIEYSMRLDQALAIASGTLGEFEGTLADELCALEELATILQNKATLIKAKDPKLSVEPTVTAMTAIVDQFRGLLPAPQPVECLPRKSSRNSEPGFMPETSK